MNRILENLNDGQKESVLSTEGPLLIVAGAGSGKTTVLIRRVANLVQMGVEPESILLLTFTNVAAANMLEKAKNCADSRCGNVLAMTYHSFCARELRHYGRFISLEPSFTIYSQNDSEDLMKLIRSTHPECKKKGFPRPAAILSYISEAANKMLTLDQVLEDHDVAYDVQAVIKKLDEEYRSEKKKRNVLDYDDLLTYMVKLLRHPVAHNTIIHNFNYVMVDEYQDTNKLQAEILFGLANEKGNIAVVGDDYQSIYAFRGADITNILGFESQAKERLGRDAKRTYLEVNYRSTKEILDLANSVMKNKANFGYPKTLRPRNDKARGPKPTLLSVENQNDQTEAVMEQVSELLKSGVPASEIAILSRSSYSTAAIEIQLQGMGIDFIKRGGLKFLERKSVRDMVAYMTVLMNPYDDTKWFRILKLHPGIGDVYAKRIIENCLTDSDFLIHHRYTKYGFFGECELLHDTLSKIRAEEDFHKQGEMLRDFYIALEERVAENMDTDDDTREALFEEIEGWKEDIAILLDLAKNFNTVSAFLDYITVDPSLSDDKQNAGLLTISTIHSAKGLEWDYVFLLDCSESVFPRETMCQEDYNEELRCFYVAITRARKELHLFSPLSVVMYGSYIRTFVSSFLNGSEKMLDMSSRCPETYADDGFEGDTLSDEAEDFDVFS